MILPSYKEMKFLDQKCFTTNNSFKKFGWSQVKAEIRRFKLRQKIHCNRDRGPSQVEQNDIEYAENIEVAISVSANEKPENSDNEIIIELCESFLRLCQHSNEPKCI